LISYPAIFDEYASNSMSIEGGMGKIRLPINHVWDAHNLNDLTVSHMLLTQQKSSKSTHSYSSLHADRWTDVIT